MSLTHYQRKRDFLKTAEPRGKVQKNTGPLTFVVQRHEARQLHYDFRLELDGVLKSWAVPKGPSLDPEDKRMAVMVEDHPMDYASFEGIIPKGSYGGGTVMVWDQGVYTPYESKDRKTSEKILRKQLEEGHLTFIMLGKKLKGEFALIKAPRMGEDTWLLIKKGDEYASKKDILKEDHSVVTHRTMSEIAKQAQKKKEIWYSKPKDVNIDDAPKTSMPKHIKPMLADSVDKPFSRKDWIFEMKWDGYRAIAEVEKGNVSLYSRNHQDFSEKFKPVADSLTKLPGNAVLDGEVVVVDETGRPVFQWLQDYPKSKKGQLRYYIFDLLYYDGRSLTGLPLRERKEILRKILPPLPHLYFSDHVEEEGKEFFAQAQKLHLEGIIGKNAESAYRVGVRTHNWIKIKTKKEVTALIAGFTKPKGGRKHLGALVLGVMKKNKLTYIGHTGGGFTDEQLKEMEAKLLPLAQESCPFATKPETNAPVTWVKPVFECEVSFTEWTQEGQMRQPIFIKMVEEDSDKEENDEPRIFAKEATDGSVTTVEIDKHTLSLANLQKVFWPKEGYTKGDVITYYRDVAKVILPYLYDRPESLLRFPDGITGKSFFQKNSSNLNADWVDTITIRKEGKAVEYILCQNEATLVYMLNLGCIDLNPWNSRVKTLEKPDYLLIDLDPEAIAFEHVITVAQETHKLLEKLSIPSFCKTSGARGLHIYIPMGAKYSYDHVRKFAELLCLQVHNELPDITSMIRNPKERQGKVYLDYLQNSRGQTLASAYSIRPQPEATVSTPLLWSEVNKKLHPSQFTIKNMQKRLDKHGDLFKGVLGKGVKIEKALTKIETLLETNKIS